MQFHLILTLDYEVFGNGSGCLEHCVTKPVAKLQKLLGDFDAPCTFFVDATEFSAMERCGLDTHGIKRQLSELNDDGHSIQLHLHPQWLDAQKNGPDWQLDMELWRIGDLAPQIIERAVQEGLEYLSQFTDGPLNCFRAGGWCIQPSEHVLAKLYESGITLDSTVAPGVYNPARGDWFDFRRSETKPYWSISTDVCQENVAGKMVEVPIATAGIGFVSHLQEHLDSRTRSGFPEGCSGSYAGPNTKNQERLAKLAKLASLGTAMLDFSTLSGKTLIEIVQKKMDHAKALDGESQQVIPVVAIGHNKNFTDHSIASLKALLEWSSQVDSIQFSTYETWRQATGVNL